MKRRRSEGRQGVGARVGAVGVAVVMSAPRDACGGSRHGGTASPASEGIGAEREA
jgi:hypothetical protein